jgi:hypothetical protein
MYNKKVWKGREVEGRYSDLMTVFVRDLPDTSKADIGVKYSEYPHYYFTIEYMRKCYENTPYIQVIRDILDQTNMAVTIEADKDTIERITPDLVNRCHIIYRIHDKALQVLKDTDTLSIDAGWYRVHQVTKLNMMEITPSSYKFDEEL